MKRQILAVVVMMGIFAGIGTAHAAITIDGYLHNDWGVTPGVFGASDWTPFAGIIGVVEDQNTDKLTPGYGGQRYDAEAIYYKNESGNLYLAIVTGMRPEGYTWLPGDIYLNFGAGKEYGIKTIGAKAGYVYKNPGWNTSPYWGGVTDPTNMKKGTGTLVGQLGANFKYIHSYPALDTVKDPDGHLLNDHYVMEMAIPENWLGTDWVNGGTAHWTQTCGNDGIDLTIPRTPEPVSVVLFGIGVVGFFGRRKKSRV